MKLQSCSSTGLVLCGFVLIPLCVQRGNIEVRAAHLNVAALNAQWYQRLCAKASGAIVNQAVIYQTKITVSQITCHEASRFEQVASLA